MSATSAAPTGRPGGGGVSLERALRCTTACATLRHAMLRCTAVYSAATCSLGCTDRPARMGARHLEAHGARYPTRHGIPRDTVSHETRYPTRDLEAWEARRFAHSGVVRLVDRDLYQHREPGPGGCRCGSGEPREVWDGRAQSRCRCGAVSPVPAQMWEGRAHAMALFLDKPHPR